MLNPEGRANSKETSRPLRPSRLRYACCLPTCAHPVRARLNLVMLAVLTFSVRRRVFNRAAAIAAIEAFAVNTQWVLGAGAPGDLRIGYYVWMLSFLLVGCGLLLAKRVSTQPLAAAAT